jgi:hypothetical protein
VDTTSFFADLRKNRHAEGEETWTSLKYHLPGTTRFTVLCSWDEEPDRDVSPPDQRFREELEMFPRRPEKIPLRLRERSASWSHPSSRSTTIGTEHVHIG